MPFLAHNQPPSKHPIVIEDIRMHSKDHALSAMKELEGWCTENKASILYDLILKNKPQTIVEIGVFGGKSLIPMAFALKQNGKGRIYGIDPWLTQESIDGMDGANLEWWKKVDHQKILDDLVAKIGKFGLKNEITLIRSTSEKAPPIAHIDLLHVDGNHAENKALLDLKKWVPLVKSGGLIVFDDIYWSTTKHAVEWLDQNCLRVSVYKDNCGWGIWYKR